MLRLEFIEGAPGSNEQMANFARRACKTFAYRKRTRVLTPAERIALSAATIRETSAHEVVRRMELRAAKLENGGL